MSDEIYLFLLVYFTSHVGKWEHSSFIPTLYFIKFLLINLWFVMIKMYFMFNFRRRFIYNAVTLNQVIGKERLRIPSPTKARSKLNAKVLCKQKLGICIYIYTYSLHEFFFFTISNFLFFSSSFLLTLSNFSISHSNCIHTM